MADHSGHRQRMKDRFIKHGLDNFNDVNALELLLFFAIPRGDTNPLAHDLIDRFGSLNAVLSARPEELMKVKGVGQTTAMLIKLVPEFSRRYMMSFSDSVTTFNSSYELGKFFVPRFMFMRDEELHIMCLDDMNRMLYCNKLFSGVPNSAEINIRKIAEVAISTNATQVVLAHNHPDGVAIPSQDDRNLTRKIQLALMPMGIQLLDHIIVGGDDFVSLREDSKTSR